MRHALKIVIIILLVPFVAFAAAWWQLHSDIGHRFADDTDSYSRPGIPYFERTFRTADGITIASWYVPADDAKAVVILVHGYAPKGGKADMLRQAIRLHDAGYATLLVDLRGVGDSGGNRVSLGVEEWKDLAAAYDYAKSIPENRDKKVGFFGESMGGATAIIAAARSGKGDFVVTVAPFASYDRLFGHRVKTRGFGWMPGAAQFVKLAAMIELRPDYERFSPEKLIGDIRVPVFVAWSSNDDEIGPDQGSSLFALANEPKERWETALGHRIAEKDLDGLMERTITFIDGVAVGAITPPR